MKPLNYKSSGVDICAGGALVRDIRVLARRTYRPGVVGEIGGFGGFFQLNLRKYRNPVLVSGTDGVGTKLKIAQELGRHETVGIDLVAMCVNDILVSGAEPLFFLDYMATGRLHRSTAKSVIRGMVTGCRMAGCALIGGETAELPGMLQGGEYDLAGFAVGVVDKSHIIDGRGIKAGDRLIGLRSSGLHSNGYSLARRILLKRGQLKLSQHRSGIKKTIGEELLIPTRIYSALIRGILANVKPRGMVHVTGGGLTENIPRILPRGLGVVIQRGSWPIPEFFSFIEMMGKVRVEEMFRVFNMGIGMVLIVRKHEVSALFDCLAGHGESGYQMGEVVYAKKSPRVRYV